MKKIRLDLDQLSVESFATARDRGAEKGTVRGHDSEVGSCFDDDCTFGCLSHSGLDAAICICPLRIDTNHHSCNC